LERLALFLPLPFDKDIASVRIGILVAVFATVCARKRLDTGAFTSNRRPLSTLETLALLLPLALIGANALIAVGLLLGAFANVGVRK
jgi:hypothetical protein